MLPLALHRCLIKQTLGQFGGRARIRGVTVRTDLVGKSLV
jgi:uncharacterized protein (DUF433 family)